VSISKTPVAGKTAFLTGGGSGINLAIAERYAEHGARVALVGRQPGAHEGCRRH